MYGRKQASIQTHACVHCSPASVGLAQARFAMFLQKDFSTVSYAGCGIYNYRIYKNSQTKHRAINYIVDKNHRIGRVTTDCDFYI